MEFLQNLHVECLSRGFKIISQDMSRIADSAGFTLGKEESTTLCIFQALDLSKLNMEQCLILRDREMEMAAAANPMYSSVWVVFLWVGGVPSAEGEGYFGQSPYAVYWHIDPILGSVSHSPDQPDDVAGLKAIINVALTKSADGEIKEIAPPNNVINISEYLNQVPIPAPRERKARNYNSPPVCTMAMVVINLFVLLLMYYEGFAQNPVLVAARFGAIVPSLIWGNGEFYRLFTAMFIHFGWGHLFFNVAGMLIFGTRIERYYGKPAFLFIYIISGLVASTASLFLTQGFSAGASGAVYGLLGAALAYTKFTGRSMDMINKQVVVVYIVMGLVMGFIMPNIDYFGHIGGLIAGIITGLLALKIIGEGRL